MNAQQSQTLVLIFKTNKANNIRVQINQPKANLSASEIKTIMEELISLAAITNANEELICGIKSAGLTQRTVESISF